MMSHRLLGLSATVLLACATLAHAEEPPFWRQAGMKLVRGAINVSTGWIELPKQIYLIGQEEGWGVGVWRGPIDGLGMFIARTVAGAYDVLTFPIPVPPRYQPLFEPSYVWQDDPPPSARTVRSTAPELTLLPSEQVRAQRLDAIQK